MSYERENIKAMSGYVSGEQPEDAKTIKLNTNENPYSPAPEIQQAIANFSSDALRRYPPPTADKFRDLAAKLHKVDRCNIIATRGGDELLRLLITTYVDPGQCIGMTDPTYSLYPVLAQVQDCPVVKIALADDWSLPEDFAAQINAAGCKLTFLVNPQAPSGKLLDTESISAIADELESVLLVDEAYIDFVSKDYSSVPLIFRHDNVVILRTLSKGFSLAGLRFGYGIAAESLISPMLEKTRDSYNLDLLSQIIAETALENRSHAMKNCEMIIDQRTKLQSSLIDTGLVIEPSETNFLLATVPEAFCCSAAELYNKLKLQGILIRYFSDPRLSDKVRITVGTAEENGTLIKAIQQIQKA
jgi:histidinol-phosphate aminotransferase